jgi:thiol-disulfide isomerase/thioredoxin
MFKNGSSAILLVITFLPVILLSQEVNNKIIDPRLNKEILYGYCDRSGLQDGEFGNFFKTYYQVYSPDKTVVSQLKEKKEGVEILIVLGTWCKDCQEQVPRFFKILDQARFSKKNVQLICVSRDKEAGEVDVINYDIQKVPTFIIYRKGREIGRIIERPYLTLEKDLLMFFSDN